MFRHDHPRPEIEWVFRSSKGDRLCCPLLRAISDQQRQASIAGKCREVGIAFLIVDFPRFSMSGIHPLVVSSSNSICMPTQARAWLEILPAEE
ncbi:MAG: hypothetical protein ABGX16_17145 [Pirellulales bacterium]